MPLPSPLPSRSAMIQGAQGDPFLGALIPAIGGLVKFAAPKIARFLGFGAKSAGRGTMVPSVGPMTSAMAGRPASRSALIARVPGVAGRFLPRIIKAGAAGGIAGTVVSGASQLLGGAGGSVLIDALTGEPVQRRRRRMNPLNPKALRRATRRLASFNKMAKKTQSELAKLAPARARRSPARSTESHRATVTHDR